MNEPVDLTFAECVDLLSGGVIGRVALATPVGPRIIPINYAFHGDELVFRTTPYSELGTYGVDTDAAFEIDHFDYDRHQGWSVVVVGRLRRMDPEEIADLAQIWEPRPWAGGHRPLHLGLSVRDVSGRRIGSEWTRASMMPVRRVL